MSFDTAACVRRAQAGDAGAFAELYSLVYKDLYRISLLNLNNNEQDASDVVSDTVLEAYRNIPKLRDPSSFRSWITAILTAQINKKLKEYHKERNLREDIDNLEETQPDKAQTETDFDSVALRQAMQSLSEDERMILTLSAVSGYTSEEIARITGTAAGTVRSKAARAKAKLRALLGDNTATADAP